MCPNSLNFLLLGDGLVKVVVIHQSLEVSSKFSGSTCAR